MYDVAIIGAGVVGGMIARALAKYEVKLCIVDKAGDVAMGATRANSAIVHAGFDAAEGSMKARMNVRGSQMMKEVCQQLGVKYKNNGALVVAFDDEDLKMLEELKTRGETNGVEQLYIIDKAESNISEAMIKELHRLLKSGTSDSRVSWFAVGDYKKVPNEVGGRETTAPEFVAAELISAYNLIENKTFEDIIDFHYRFEKIHPFQDGNGRVGRLILFKECLKYGFVPFIIDEELKMFYYRGLSEWQRERGYLIDTCLAAQDKFKRYLDYFRVPYNN